MENKLKEIGLEREVKLHMVLGALYMLPEEALSFTKFLQKG